MKKRKTTNQLPTQKKIFTKITNNYSNSNQYLFEFCEKKLILRFSFDDIFENAGIGLNSLIFGDFVHLKTAHF